MYSFAYDYRSRRYHRATSTETNLCVFDGGLSMQEYNGQQPSTNNLPQERFVTEISVRGGIGQNVFAAG